jgi:hypothetical protein
MGLIVTVPMEAGDTGPRWSRIVSSREIPNPGVATHRQDD